MWHFITWHLRLQFHLIYTACYNLKNSISSVKYNLFPIKPLLTPSNYTMIAKDGSYRFPNGGFHNFLDNWSTSLYRQSPCYIRALFLMTEKPCSIATHIVLV